MKSATWRFPYDARIPVGHTVGRSHCGGGRRLCREKHDGPTAAEIVAASPSAPAVPLADVLILTADVPMGQPLFENIGWERWPEAGVDEGFITKSEPDAVEKLKGTIARVALYKGEPVPQGQAGR